MPMLQESDPFHNIPRSQIVSKHANGNKSRVLLACVLLSGLAAFFFRGAWVDKVVPDKYLFASESQPPDKDYLPPKRR